MNENISLTSLLHRFMNREAFLGIFTLSFGGIAGLVVGIPIIGYVLGPLINQPGELWEDIRYAEGHNAGKRVTLGSFPVGRPSRFPSRLAGHFPGRGRPRRRARGCAATTRARSRATHCIARISAVQSIGSRTRASFSVPATAVSSTPTARWPAGRHRVRCSTTTSVSRVAKSRYRRTLSPSLPRRSP